MMDLGFWELLAATLSAIFTIALIVLIIYSVFWFAFPKKKRTRWKVISGWYFFGCWEYLQDGRSSTYFNVYRLSAWSDNRSDLVGEDYSSDKVGLHSGSEIF